MHPSAFLKNKPKPILVYRRLLSPKLITYIAYLNGQPASTAMAIMTEQVAGIYWVGATKAARGRGLAEVLRAISK